MPHLLVVRGPSRAGKSSLAKSLEDRFPDHFGIVLTDHLPPPEGYPNPPKTQVELDARRTAQVVLWGRLVRDFMDAGRNVILDCDLQVPGEVTILRKVAGIPIPGPDVMIIRLGVSRETAISRRANLTIPQVTELHEWWSAPSLTDEEEVNTEGRDPDGLSDHVLELVRKKWPRAPSTEGSISSQGS
jgi:hypothetical protein